MKAYDIAYLAHKAVSQKRADGITPYIIHPMRVHYLINSWSLEIAYMGLYW